MNREDVIRMAREAMTPESPFGAPNWGDPSWSFDADELERFFQAAFAAGAAAEREACAKVCDEDQSQAGEWTADAHVGGYFAARIRARGQA